MQDADDVAAAIARAQRGVVGRAQLLERGVSRAAIDRRVRAGRWARLAPGVFGLPSHPGTWERQLWVALIAHPVAALGLGTAAVVQELPGFQRGRIHMVAPPGSVSRSSVATLHRFDGARTTMVRGMRVTTLAQTIADLCATVWAPRLDTALDHLILSRRVTLDDLRERVDAYAGARRPGVELLRSLVDERADGAWRPTESMLEVELRAMLALVPGRPRVIWQPALPWRPSTGERLDALLPDHGVIVEADGRTWHARVADFDRDRWRDNEASAHGLASMRFTWVHLTTRRTASAQLVAETLARRSAVRGASDTDADGTAVAGRGAA